MALTWFTRRPEPVEAPAPEPWPETAETWTPEGVTVVERYLTLGYAVVLVYRCTGFHVVACLGCHHQTTRLTSKYGTLLSLEQAAELANTHAAGCRAVPRAIPARPDDAAAREQLRTLVRGLRARDENVSLCLFHLDLHRLSLQRTNGWITVELERLADDEPEVLKVSVTAWSTDFRLQALPES
ncbi:hypothetical protein ACIPW5_37085 [Streptomyces sp. NPDC090077]|uniref:hypothetical protein n=1 Tax=Streptomyces sp. NPDC090077 TaxID=3365938 RepID=UPI00380FDB8F